jgi:hypothetical protein
VIEELCAWAASRRPLLLALAFLSGSVVVLIAIELARHG